MADEARVTAELEYAEILSGCGVRATAVQEYAEISIDRFVKSTAVQEYAEISAGAGISVTAILGYIEIGPRVITPCAFAINGSIVPWYATADRMNPPVVRYPEPRARYGGGRPARAIGLPSAIVGREWISQEGLNWWMSLFEATDNPYISASVTLYDPLSNGWRSGSGYIWKPEYKSADNIYSEFRVRITGLEFWE